jgi:hypothetical protein
MHLIQNELEGFPVLVAYVPVPHAKQKVLFVAARDVEYVPAMHLTQIVLSVLPEAVLYDPA